MRLGITIAHEICHVLTSFLLYDPNATTPPQAVYGSCYGSEVQGEAGRYWEYITFGGFIDMRASIVHPNGGADIAIAIRDKHSRHAWVLQTEAVQLLVGNRGKLS